MKFVRCKVQPPEYQSNMYMYVSEGGESGTGMWGHKNCSGGEGSERMPSCPSARYTFEGV